MKICKSCVGPRRGCPETPPLTLSRPSPVAVLETSTTPAPPHSTLHSDVATYKAYSFFNCYSRDKKQLCSVLINAEEKYIVTAWVTAEWLWCGCGVLRHSMGHDPSATTNKMGIFQLSPSGHRLPTCCTEHLPSTRTLNSL